MGFFISGFDTFENIHLTSNNTTAAASPQAMSIAMSNWDIIVNAT